MNINEASQLYRDILDYCAGPKPDADDKTISAWIVKEAAQRDAEGEAIADVDQMIQIFEWIEREGKDHLAGHCGAMMTELYALLDDDRAEDFAALLAELIEAEPLERDRLVDQVLQVVE